MGKTFYNAMAKFPTDARQDGLTMHCAAVMLEMAEGQVDKIHELLLSPEAIALFKKHVNSEPQTVNIGADDVQSLKDQVAELQLEKEAWESAQTALLQKHATEQAAADNRIEELEGQVKAASLPYTVLVLPTPAPGTPDENIRRGLLKLQTLRLELYRQAALQVAAQKAAQEAAQEAAQAAGTVLTQEAQPVPVSTYWSVIADVADTIQIFLVPSLEAKGLIVPPLSAKTEVKQ